MMQQEATPILNVSHLSKTFPIKRNIAEIARKKESEICPGCGGCDFFHPQRRDIRSGRREWLRERVLFPRH